MSKHIIERIRPEHITLTLTQNAFRQSQDAAWSIDDFYFRDYDIFICYGGCANFIHNDSVYTLKEGMGFLAEKGERVSARFVGPERFEAIAQHFELQLFTEADFFTLFEYSPIVTFTHWDGVASAMDNAERIQDTPTQKYIRQSLVEYVIAEFINDAYISDTHSVDQKYAFILEMSHEIAENLDDDVIVEKISGRSPFGADYTSRLFKRFIGYPPKKYQTQLRLRKSKNLLMRGAKVRDSAFESGFNDELYFSRIFKKYEGVTPSEYRANTSGV